HKFLISYAYLIPIFAIISLFKYYLLINGVLIAYFEKPGWEYPIGTSLMPDYNMYSLGMLVGLIALTYLIKTTDKLFLQLGGILSGLLVIIASLFSSSKRGIILILIVIFYFIFIITRKFAINTIKQNTIILSSIFIFSLSFFFFFKDQLNFSITNEYE